MKNNQTIFDCNIIHFSKIFNLSGNITVVENSKNIPFDVRRVYYMYDIPGGESRGAHAHKELESVIIALSGSFDVTLDDGVNKKTVMLNRPYLGLNVKPGIWRDISNFSSGSICLVLASEVYNESDYIRSYENFIKFKR